MARIGHPNPEVWEKIVRDRRKVEAQKDQSVRLPDSETFTLYKIRTVLTDDGDFEEWHRAIMGIGSNANIHGYRCKTGFLILERL